MIELADKLCYCVVVLRQKYFFHIGRQTHNKVHYSTLNCPALLPMHQKGKAPPHDLHILSGANKTSRAK